MNTSISQSTRTQWLSTRQYWFKATPASEWSQQELLFWCPKTVCAAHVIQPMVQKHNTRSPYGNVNKKQTYKTLTALIAVILCKPVMGATWFQLPGLSQHFVFTFQQWVYGSWLCWHLFQRGKKENWSIKFPKAAKQNQECLWENWKQIAMWTQLPGILELIGPALTRCYYRNYS